MKRLFTSSRNPPPRHHPLSKRRYEGYLLCMKMLTEIQFTLQKQTLYSCKFYFLIATHLLYILQQVLLKTPPSIQLLSPSIAQMQMLDRMRKYGTR